MNNLPFVSIIVPVYNGEKIIGECIESLLNQDYPKDKYEIIIVDNNSKDKTAEVIKKYPVKYLLEDKIQSSYAARNTGARFAKGEALAFFDADQLADTRWLSSLLNGWEDADCGAFKGRYVYLELSSILKEMSIHGSSDNEVQRLDCQKLGGGNTIYRKDVFDALKGFDFNMFSGGDFHFGWRMQKELNLKARYNADAIAYQKGRTLTQHLKREFRIGFGDYLLNLKNFNTNKSLWFSTARLTKRTILSFGALILSFFKPLKFKSRKIHVLIILLGILICWANYLGKLQCFLSNGKRLFPAHW